MRKNIKNLCILLSVLIMVTSCSNNDVLKEPITYTDYFMKLPVEELNVKINSDEYYVRSGFYTEHDLFWWDYPASDNYSIDETWPRSVSFKSININNKKGKNNEREEFLRYFGFVNKDSEIIIEPKYGYATNFEYGLASVNKQTNKDGLGERIILNEDGSIVKKFKKFEDVKFINGLAFTKYKKDKENEHNFTIDTEGNLLYDKEKREAYPITFKKDSHTLGMNRVAGLDIHEGRYVFLINTEGNVLIPEEDKFIIFAGQGQKNIFGYKNFGAKYMYFPIFSFDKNYGEYDIRVAVLDLDGNVVSKWMDYDLEKSTLMDRYEFHKYCSDGLFIIYDTKTKKYGYMSIIGDIVIEPQFERVNPFSEGLASVSDGEKYGFIDTTGKLVIPMKYEMLSESEPDINKSFLYDRRGINSGPFGAVYFSQGLCAVNENGKYGFIDKTGNFVIPPQFDEPSNFYEDVATCKIGNYYYIIEKKK